MKSITTKKKLIETLEFVAILVLLYFIITLSFTYLPFLNQYNTFSIQTNSMEPVINVGTVVIVKDIEPEDIAVDDIVAFMVDITGDGEDEVVVHYIAEINVIDNALTFRTKPEISDTIDRWTIEEDDIVGIYQGKIPGVGNMILFTQSWIGRIIIVLDLVIFSFVYDYLFNKDNRKKKKQETMTNDLAEYEAMKALKEQTKTPEKP